MALLFTTSRLDVFEITTEMAQGEALELLGRIPQLLTPAVVERLPSYFHGIESQGDARLWLERMVSESRLFAVTLHSTNLIIGFIFAYVESESDTEAHIGYLLGKSYWGQGLAYELLQAFIKQANQTQGWTKLIAGVEANNLASSRLLLKLGFAQRNAEGSVIFYEYPPFQSLS